MCYSMSNSSFPGSVPKLTSWVFNRFLILLKLMKADLRAFQMHHPHFLERGCLKSYRGTHNFLRQKAQANGDRCNFINSDPIVVLSSRKFMINYVLNDAPLTISLKVMRWGWLASRVINFLCFFSFNYPAHGKTATATSY